MKFAEDFRREARNALTKKWSLAVGVGLVAYLLGGSVNSNPQFKLTVDKAGLDVNLEYVGQKLFSVGSVDSVRMWIEDSTGFILLTGIVMSAVTIVLGSLIAIGYSRFNLNLIDRHPVAFENLFKYFSHCKTAVASRLLRALYIFLWSLLLLIPGIIAEYSYAMTDFILAENPNLTASEAIARSKDMMRGNRWRLFCLEFSFIGWDLLVILTFGIGNLWLIPYKYAAKAAFYRDIS